MLKGQIRNDITNAALNKDKTDDKEVLEDEKKAGKRSDNAADNNGSKTNKDNAGATSGGIGTDGGQDDGQGGTGGGTDAISDEDKQEIEELQAKISALDDKLLSFRTAKTDDTKRQALEKARYSPEQIDKYISHIQGETAEDIRISVDKLKDDIKPDNAVTYADPSLNNGANGKPSKNTAEDMRNYGREVLKKAQKDD